MSSPEEKIDLIAAEQEETGTMSGGQPIDAGPDELEPDPQAQQQGPGALQRLLAPAPRKPEAFVGDAIAENINTWAGDETEPPGLIGECGVGESTACTLNAVTGRGSGNFPPLVYLTVAMARWFLTRAQGDEDTGSGDGDPNGGPVVPDVPDTPPTGPDGSLVG